MPSPKSRRSSLRRNSIELLQQAKHFQEKYIFHPFWISQSMGKIENITQIPDVDIAEAGEFGAADHEKTLEILQKKYHQWTINITDDEY
ncbi:unnamed protein product [Rotaria magnacalcarata]|uniref:Uncharacterized protein n=1 Tax=Rotaria magnacalcarata TaxID=392030 RepID=A0A816SZQ8_9BILA|nr:unnamed protein product [Rotaria magnacalcarata]